MGIFIISALPALLSCVLTPRFRELASISVEGGASVRVPAWCLHGSRQVRLQGKVTAWPQRTCQPSGEIPKKRCGAAERFTEGNNRAKDSSCKRERA